MWRTDVKVWYHISLTASVRPRNCKTFPIKRAVSHICRPRPYLPIYSCMNCSHQPQQDIANEADKLCLFGQVNLPLCSFPFPIPFPWEHKLPISKSKKHLRHKDVAWDIKRQEQLRRTSSQERRSNRGRSTSKSTAFAQFRGPWSLESHPPCFTILISLGYSTTKQLFNSKGILICITIYSGLVCLAPFWILAL